MSPRPTASGFIDETGPCVPEEVLSRRWHGTMFYHPDTYTIYWEVDDPKIRGHPRAWDKAVIARSTLAVPPTRGLDTTLHSWTYRTEKHLDDITTATWATVTAEL